MKKLLIYFLIIINGVSTIYSMEGDNQPMLMGEVLSVDQLPVELKEYIISLTVRHEDDIGKIVKNLLLMSHTNREWREIIGGPVFWRRIFINFFKKILKLREIVNQIHKSETLLKKIEMFQENWPVIERPEIEDSECLLEQHEIQDKKRKINANSINQIDVHLKLILNEVKINLNIRKALCKIEFEDASKLINEAQKIEKGELLNHGLLAFSIFIGSKLNSHDKLRLENLIYNFIDFFAKKIDINIGQNSLGVTMIMAAAVHGYLQVAKYLIEKGADVNLQIKNGSTALMIAAESGHLDVARLLIENGANVNAQRKDSVTSLMLAAQGGFLEIVRLLIIKGANVNAQSQEDATALMSAAQNGYLEVARLLIENGANVNAQTKKSETSLMLAAQGGHLKIVRLLIKKGANVNMKNYNGWTALMVAAFLEHADIIKLLIKSNADVTLENINGETAFEILEMQRRKRKISKKY